MLLGTNKFRCMTRNKFYKEIVITSHYSIYFIRDFEINNKKKKVCNNIIS